MYLTLGIKDFLSVASPTEIVAASSSWGKLIERDRRVSDDNLAGPDPTE